MSKYDLQAAAAKYAMTQTGIVNACGCIGPQDGEPLCPCAMRNVLVKNGRYVIPERDLGPARLLQDETQTRDTKGLSQWFAANADARLRAREAAEAIAAPTPSMDTLEGKS